MFGQGPPVLYAFAGPVLSNFEHEWNHPGLVEQYEAMAEERTAGRFDWRSCGSTAAPRSLFGTRRHIPTAGPVGRPQISTVYLLACEDGTVQLSVNATRQKLQNMVDNPMVDLRDMDQPGEHRTVVTVSLTRVRAVDMRVPGAVRSSLNR